VTVELAMLAPSDRRSVDVGRERRPRYAPSVSENAPAVVYLLCGFVGSGKSTYARKLEGKGAVRLSIDEAVFEAHGRHGVDYPEDRYPEYSSEALELLDRRLRDLVAEGRSVVLDYGLWSKADRDHYKAIADTLGARWELLYFEASDDLLKARLSARNSRADANALTVMDRHFQEFKGRFTPPSGEGETVIRQS